eukprot:1427866-Rhodomonas_salina.6
MAYTLVAFIFAPELAEAPVLTRGSDSRTRIAHSRVTDGRTPSLLGNIRLRVTAQSVADTPRNILMNSSAQMLTRAWLFRNRRATFGSEEVLARVRGRPAAERGGALCGSVVRRLCR